MNMPLNFGNQVAEKSFDDDIIPKDTLLWVHLNLRGFKNSSQTNGRYMDLELTVAENQPFAKRKIWDMIADPFDALNSEEWRNMAYGSIRRILEATKGATPDNANSYALNALEELSGLVVPVVIRVEKGNDKYPDDKNKVEYLSPQSSVKKIVECMGLLNQGIFTCAKEKKAAAAPTQGSMFTGTATPPPAQMQQATPPPAAATPPAGANNWLASQPPAQQAAPPVQQQVAPVQQAAPPAGFQQGQAPAQQQVQHAAPTAVGQQPISTSPENQSASPATFPSNGTAT